MTDPVNEHPEETMSSPCDVPRTIRRAELRPIVPLADTTIYEMEQRGDSLAALRYRRDVWCGTWRKSKPGFLSAGKSDRPPHLRSNIPTFASAGRDRFATEVVEASAALGASATARS